MESVVLGFKSFDTHELACHFVARHLGLYARHGLEVRLLDTTFIPDSELPPRMFHAACGAALSAWLGGVDMRVVFVAADRPMFWLYVRPDVRQLSDLEGNVVAGYPSMAPPSLFFRAILQAHSVNQDRVVVTPARDDIARVGLLDDGSVAAALISSAIMPRSMEDRGFEALLCLGDEIHIPTTGLAVDKKTIESEPDLVVAMCGCYLEALERIHNAPGVLEAALSATLPALEAEQVADRVRDCYTRDGRVDAAILDTAIEMMSTALNVTNAGTADSLYDFSALAACPAQCD